ncbi:hypothetical protein SBOR_2293 [Sclerotinia borealis F-4128]|uniref:Pseudouridine synthase I TruA alpha/beta domain-containing protein n=1 Tax=Sclerotinia borealis (strain F-4128) TaxID=1432307 RepID=W9CS87_SCLBF|nr:hypothetical protein SBOR_2293 [Sclerotinia borealis F-4128]
MAGATDYSDWSHENLIKRVTHLENELKVNTKSAIPANKKNFKKPRCERDFDPSKYNTRLVALKLAYLGKNYNGFEHHSHVTPLPTIEEELWKALNKARLVFPEGVNPMSPGDVNWEGCEYSKCGRTDKGVSAFGQVIAIRLRSNRPLSKPDAKPTQEESGEGEEGGMYHTYPRENGIEVTSAPLSPPAAIPGLKRSDSGAFSLSDPEIQESLDFNHITDEIPYPQILNRLLPPDIRIVAWCPSPPLDFSARFSCRERRYRYFFTQPAFSPVPTQVEHGTSASKMKDGWLDIDAMREAAKSFEGLHDFRNFCKVDPGKQLTNFERRIFFADIEEVDDYTSSLAYVNGDSFIDESIRSKTDGESNAPKIYTFTLHGSAFLWHQVRHMVAILFLVGQGLEKPSVVSELLNADKNPGRPTYEMATDTPLVLWDCIFPHRDDPTRTDALDWHYIGDTPGFSDGKYGPAGLMDDLWTVWRERKIDSILAGELMGIVSRQGIPASELTGGEGGRGGRSQKVFAGNDKPRMMGKYIGVMNKIKMDTVEVVNERYVAKKGLVVVEQKKGFRKVEVKGALNEKGEVEVEVVEEGDGIKTGSEI